MIFTKASNTFLRASNLDVTNKNELKRNNLSAIRDVLHNEGISERSTKQKTFLSKRNQTLTLKFALKHKKKSISKWIAIFNDESNE